LSQLSQLSDLNEQWGGKLIKDQSEVFLDFSWISFAWLTLIFVHYPNKYVEINCDNRHWKLKKTTSFSFSTYC